MKSKTTTKFIFILIVLIGAVYLLYPTYKFNSMTDEQKNALKLENKKEYFDLKSKSINLGLDLQGGMHVVLEVDIKELLDKLAKNKTQEFTEALNQADKIVQKTDENFIIVFNRILKEKGINIARFYSTAERRTESEVIDYLKTQGSEAVNRSLEILRNRVDEFGVAEPIIQKVGESRIIVELAGVTDPTRVRKLIGRTALLEFKLLKDDVISGQVAEKINSFILSKISPVDSAAEAASERPWRIDRAT